MILIPERQNLSDWLRIATWRLSASAKERIRVEIEAHYAQAVEEHRESGFSETDAHAAALTELGDPEAAGKRFRKRHLTESDADRIKKQEKQARSIWRLLYACFAFWAITTNLSPFWHNWLADYHSPPLFQAAAFLVCVALPTSCFVVARFTRSERHGTTLFVLRMVSDFAAYVLIYAAFIQPVFNTASFIDGCLLLILFSPYVIIRLFISLRIWIKLSKASNTNLGQAS